MNKTKGLKAFFISDWHAPYEDKASLQNVLNFMYEQKPKIVVLGGDLLDFYEVSNFSKSPDRMQTLQEELDIVRGYLEEIRKKLPKARIIYLEGNHEYRLIRYLHNNPELYSLRDLRVPKLLRLKELKIEYKKEFLYCNFLFKHGEFAVPQTAYKEYTHEGCSGVSGHTHRMQNFLRTDRFGTKGWWVSGHLGDDTKAMFGSAHKDWQHGFIIVNFEENTNIPHVEQILIDIKTHQFIYGGTIYAP